MVGKITDSIVEKAGVTGLCEGANLRTPCGERRVEFLRKGDLVVTRDNGLQPVVMIWTRKIAAAEAAADPSLAPVHLTPRAIAPMMPSKPLKVGGAHRLLIPGWRIEEEEDSETCLVAARDVDGLDLSSDPGPGDVTYYNVVFDAPQVFCANGMPVESFTPCEADLGELPREARADLREAFPDLGPKFSDYPPTPYRRRARVSYTPDFA
ncbi:MAG: Hint domain-containing protein [Silicimonas sp.]|nr:Hint domain-containing protein [Silicimonas sp.]